MEEALRRNIMFCEDYYWEKFASIKDPEVDYLTSKLKDLGE